MASHKNYSNLKKAILQKAKKGMKEEVHEHIVLDMKTNILRKVYNVYEPKKYQRRYARNGGLVSDEAIRGYAVDSDKSGFTWVTRNESRASKHPQYYLTPLIVMGQIEAMNSNYGLLYYDNAEKYPYGEPRDFISSTKEDIKISSSYLTRQLEHYMNDR